MCLDTPEIISTTQYNILWKVWTRRTVMPLLCICNLWVTRFGSWFAYVKFCFFILFYYLWFFGYNPLYLLILCFFLGCHCLTNPSTFVRSSVIHHTIQSSPCILLRWIVDIHNNGFNASLHKHNFVFLFMLIIYFFFQITLIFTLLYIFRLINPNIFHENIIYFINISLL